MGVAFFKAQFRVSTYCLEMAAIPLATMQIRRIGLAAADAWQIGVARTDKGVESFLSLSLVVSVWPELCQPLLAAFAPVLFSLFLLLDALSRGFHLLLLAFFHCEDCAMLRGIDAEDANVQQFNAQKYVLQDGDIMWQVEFFADEGEEGECLPMLSGEAAQSVFDGDYDEIEIRQEWQEENTLHEWDEGEFQLEPPLDTEEGRAAADEWDER